MSQKKEIIRDLTVGSVPKVLLNFAMPLFLSGLCMGLAVASKWTGCYAGVGLALLFWLGSRIG